MRKSINSNKNSDPILNINLSNQSIFDYNENCDSYNILNNKKDVERKLSFSVSSSNVYENFSQKNYSNIMIKDKQRYSFIKSFLKDNILKKIDIVKVKSDQRNKDNVQFISQKN